MIGVILEIPDIFVGKLSDQIFLGGYRADAGPESI